MIVITGEEGDGKSTAALLIASLVDPNFTLDNVAWELTDALELALELPRGSTMLFDEGVQGLFNRGSMTTQNKTFMEWLSISRVRNLCVILCFPRLESVDLYVREHRMWRNIQAYDQSILTWKSKVNGRWEPYLVTKFPPVVGPLWAEYEERKLEFVDAQGRDALEKLRKKLKRQ